MKADPAVGATVEVDLAWSLQGGECWRATRFHVEGSWVPKDAAHMKGWSWTDVDHAGERDAKMGAYHAYEWIQWEVPPSVNTLGELCKHLVDTDPAQFPPEIYLNASKTAPLNASTMLFDYWGNSHWRAEKLKDGDVQEKYWNEPDDIPVGPVAGTQLQWVLRRKQVVAPVPAVPGGGALVTTKLMTRELFDKVHEYSERLYNTSAAIRGQFLLSENLLKRRLAIVRDARAVQIAAEVSRDSVGRGFAKDASEIASRLSDVVPKARQFMLDEPMSGSDKFNTSMNTRASIDGYTTALHDLLFTETYARTLHEWWTSMIDVVARTSGSNGAVLEIDGEAIRLDEKLQANIAAAIEVYTEAAYQGASGCGWITHERLQQLYDMAPEEYAPTAAALQGKSPLELGLSYSGKFVSTARKLSKIGVKTLQSVVAWTVYADGKRALESGAEAADAFAESIFKRIPTRLFDETSGEAIALRDTAREVIRSGDKDGANALCKKMAKTVEKNLFGVICKVFDLLSAVVALASKKDGSTVLVALTWSSEAVVVAEKALGTVAGVLNYLGKFKSLAEKLAKVGAWVGVVGAALSLAAGVVQFVEVLLRGDASGREVVAAGLKVAGGIASLVGAVLVAAGAATGVGFLLEAIGATLAIVSGAMAPSTESESRGPAEERTISQVLLDRVRWTRGTDIWILFEKSDGESAASMARVEACCRGDAGDLSRGSNTTANWSKLRSAGFPDSEILRLLMVGTDGRPNDAAADWQ